MGVWARVLGHNQDNFERNLSSNYSVFQNGLICDFIMSSCLAMIEIMKEGTRFFFNKHQ